MCKIAFVYRTMLSAEALDSARYPQLSAVTRVTPPFVLHASWNLSLNLANALAL